MAITRMTIKVGQKPTEKQKKRLREAMKREIVYDDNAPALTEAQYKAFAAVAGNQPRGGKETTRSILNGSTP